MSKPNFLITVLVAALLIASCAPAIVTPALPPTPTQEPLIPVTGSALVHSVEIHILESEPVQVNALIRGDLPDAGCTSISSIHQVRDGNTIKVTLTTTTDPLARCAQALTPFEQVVAIDVGGLLPGTYVVNVNGIEQSFDLLPRSVLEFQQFLVDALNRRDYDVLKRLMGEAFVIGYWLSEGTSNTPDAAIEQLRLNLINSSAPITADYPRNLIELLGTDPVRILGPDVIEASPLLISGLGTEGRDQAIVFVAKRADGSLYWHGLLFAKDGFVKPTPTATPTPPVDMNAYPTSVQYVMAQRDVRMRSGPGMQFQVISYLAAGQTAKVTGVSANGYWWRVICPDSSVGSCWVSADRSLTRPSDGIPTLPPPDYSAYPTSVKYVLALQDATMYSGPGAQFSVISYIAAGQTAKVTGVNVDGKWWRVICPDSTVGSCWVSAHPGVTRPTEATAGLADVQSVEIQILESYPLQVNAVARGYLPDAGCTTISGASQVRTGNTIRVTVTTKTDPLALCAQALTPFEYSIALEVGSLLPARYMVDVNGVVAYFELPHAVIPTDVQYVMAQRDVTMYSGPGTQHAVISSIAAGQTARVTGVSADGNWWRVICPDNSVGSCWVSASPSDTQASQGPA